MNCPRCNYPITKGNDWSYCPKCNCKLNPDPAPVQRVKVPQPEAPDTSGNRNIYSSSNNHFEDEYQPRRVAEQKQPMVAYCMNCGQKIEEGQKFCFRCGSAVFNPNCANQHWQPYKKPINKKVIFSICGSLLLIILIVIIVISSNNTLSNKLIGNWTTDRGMDSEYVKFKNNGKVLYGDFMDSHSSSWKLDGDTLVISGYYNNESYIYTPSAKQSSDRYTWYIEGNTLYYNNRVYYKENSTSHDND